MFGNKNDNSQSGMEFMLRSMGLGQVLDMAKQLAENGTFDKVLKFADQMEAMQAKLEAIYEEIKWHNSGPGIEPGPGSGLRSLPREIDTSGHGGTAGRSGTLGHACGQPDNDGAGP
jgi:hypothetical protein